MFQDFQGFLNDLQDWDLSLNEKDKKMKHKASSKDNLVYFFCFSFCTNKCYLLANFCN